MNKILSVLFLLSNILISSADIECGSSSRPTILTKYSGTIYSPGYTSNKPYDGGLECVWLILSSEDYKIQLTFNEIDLDEVTACKGDSILISIKKGPSKQICGKNKINDIIFDESSIEIKFKSDFVYSGKGFNISYKFTTKNTVCSSDEVQCRNRKCVPFSKLCNGNDDCGDDSDENKCRKSEHDQEFTCGQTPIKPNLLNAAKIVGGFAAIEGSWPWQADIQVDFIEPNGHNCGGALINREYVLTAAHCFLQNAHKDNFRIVFGNYGKFKKTGYEQVRYIKNYMTFPNLLNDENRPEINMLHDITLIRLSSPVKISERVQPICLPAQGFELSLNSSCFATGWGATKGTGDSSVLKQLRMYVEDPKACIIEELGLDYPNSKLCMSTRQSRNGLCSGDSGGPLAYKSDKWYLVGIASHLSASSFAGPICGLGIGESFAKVSQKIEWIENTMKKLEQLDLEEENI